MDIAREEDLRTQRGRNLDKEIQDNGMKQVHNTDKDSDLWCVAYAVLGAKMLKSVSQLSEG